MIAGPLTSGPTMQLPAFRLRRTRPESTAIDLFLLRTGRQAWLATEGRDVVMADALTAENALYLAIPQAGPQNAFLLAPDGRPICVEGDGFASPAITGRIRRVPGGRVEMRHPIASVRHLGVVTGIPVGRPDRVLFDRVGDKVLDRFTLQPAQPDALAPAGRAVLAQMALAVRPPMAAERLLNLLRTGEVRLTLAEALIRLLPADELLLLAGGLMRRPADLTLLRRAMPDDGWLNRTLPDLLAWCAKGRPVTRRAVSPPQEEHVAVLQSGELRPQVGLALQALARRAVSPRKLAMVLATARNEGPYLLDWIAHHRAVGFDHLVIYSNDNDDGSDELLGLLADHGEITWVRNELADRSRAQWKAYGHAFKVLPDPLDYRWTLVIDLDEYFSLRPDLFRSVADVIGWHEHQNADALALRWLTYVGGPTDMWRDEPSTQRFQRREPSVSPMFKSLVRSSLFWDSHCHFPYPTLDLPFAFRLEDGLPCYHMALLKGESAPADPVSADHAWIAHHVFRSAGEALLKAARGDALWSRQDRQDSARMDTVIRRFVAMADNPHLVTDQRTLQCAPGAPAQLRRLLELPCIQAVDRAIKCQFAARLQDATQAFLDAPGSPGWPPAWRRFRDILCSRSARNEPVPRGEVLAGPC